jgi:hypothetical protein
MKKISDNMKSNQQNYEDSLDSDEDNIDSVTTPLDSAKYDYECMDPRVYSAKYSAFKQLVDNFDVLDAILKMFFDEKKSWYPSSLLLFHSQSLEILES